MNNQNQSQLEDSIREGVEALRRGDLIGFPTETVYGLAAKISDEAAIRKIFALKKRPFFDPLIIHVASIDQAQSLVKSWPSSAQVLAEHFWPGPLTLVLPKQERVSDLITSGLSTVALRWPRHPLARRILEQLGEPVAAPSANQFGRTSPSTAQHVREELGPDLLVVDGGPCDVGIESTIIKIEESPSEIDLTFLRWGSILPGQIESTLRSHLKKEIHLAQPGKNIEAPGQVQHHYQPPIPVVLVDRKIWAASSVEVAWRKLNQKFAALAGGPWSHPSYLVLDSRPEQAARELYSRLRECSQSPHDVILFIKEDFHQGEAWAAILDRLTRASTFRWLIEEGLDF